MKVKFGLLIVGPFKAFASPQKFAITQMDVGLHYVNGRNRAEPALGSNGAGKSTLWDAVCWCLYGRTIKGLQGPDIKPWKGGGARVRQTVWVDGVRYDIVRTSQPNLLTINSKEANQEQVDRLIGLPYDVFKQTVLFGQGQDLFFDLDPRHKMELLSTVLDLDRWDDRASRASAAVKRLMERLVKREGEREGMEAGIREIDEAITWNEDKSSTWEKEYQATLKDAANAHRQETKSVDRYRDAIGRHDQALDSAETELRQMERDVAKLRDEVSTRSIRFNRDVDRVSARNAYRKKLSADLEALGSGDTCKTCGQSLKGTALAKHRAKLVEEIEDETRHILAGRELLNQREQALNISEASLKSHLEFVAKFQRDAAAARDALDTSTKFLNEHLAKQMALEKIINAREAEVNPYKIQMRNLRKRRASLENEIDECSRRIKRLTRRCERTQYWVRGFRDVRLFLLDEFLRDLEYATNMMLDETGLHGWQVKYDIEKETSSKKIKRGLTTLIYQKGSSKPHRWESWSGGEGQRLRIVGALALSEVLLERAGVKVNIEVLDEPTRHLSREGIHDLIPFLSERARRLGKKIFYIDHAAVESSFFSSVTTIRRDTGGSQIVHGGGI